MTLDTLTPLQRFREAVLERAGYRCEVAPIVSELVRDRPNGQGLIACLGELDAHHLVPKRVMKTLLWRLPAYDECGRLKDRRDLRMQLAMYDGRNGLAVCRRHHDLLEGRAIRLRRADLPASVETFAQELGLTWYLDRTYGP